MAGKRRFGRVRELSSGRYQARYPGPDGNDRPAPKTFPDKTAAERWLTLKEAEILSGDWLNPDAGRVSFKEYAEAWVSERPGLRVKTIERYEAVVRLHLVPTLGALGVSDIKDQHVRKWRKKLVDAGVGEATLAKSCRLLKAIMNTAVGGWADQTQPVPDQGRRLGERGRAAGAEHR
jgi:hypothetical protein